MELLERFLAQLSVVQSAWMPFGIALGVACLVIWKVMVWRHTGAIEMLQHRLQLRDDQIAALERLVGVPNITQPPPSPLDAPIELEKSPPPIQTERANSDARTFLANDVLPETLMGICRDRTILQAKRAVEPYLGKWMTVAGAVTEVYPSNTGVTVTLGMKIDLDTISHPEVMSTIWLEFDDASGHLESLQDGDKLTALGQIKKIEARDLRLVKCEVVIPT